MTGRAGVVGFFLAGVTQSLAAGGGLRRGLSAREASARALGHGLLPAAPSASERVDALADEEAPHGCEAPQAFHAAMNAAAASFASFTSENMMACS